MQKRFLFVLLYSLMVITILPYGVYAQVHDTPSKSLQISLITVLPGDQLYSLFGHSAFRVYDPVHGIDEVYNYGTFDFRDPLSFAFRFAYGRLDYMLSTESYPRSLYAYANFEHRSVIEQVLNLSPEQAQAVHRFLAVNALPENRTYRYDFLFDNCSTRLRDVLETTLRDDVRFTSEPDPNDSFRHLLDPYVAERPFLDLGFDLILGLPTDRIATPREATFLPLLLMASFGNATVEVGGERKPLVARTDTVYWAPGGDQVARTLPWATILCWIVFVIGAFATGLTYRRDRSAGRVLDTLLFGVAGIVGMVAAFMWLGTEHNVTANNLNLIWALPTHLVAAIAIWRGSTSRWLRTYLTAIALVNVLVIALWWAIPQDFHSATFPIVLLLTLRSGWRVTRLASPNIDPATPVTRPY